jgi:type IV secretory pathway VirB10-like protein
MISDKLESVEIVSEGKAKKTFLENFSYIRRESSQGKRFKIAGVLMALAAIGISFFRGEPEKEIEPAAPMSIPSVGQEQVDPTKDNYSRAEDAKQLDQNHRARKSGVPLKLSGPKLIARSRNLQIPPGTLVRAELVTGASNGAVKAVLKDDVRVNGETLIEAGSTILGRGSSTEDRLFVAFTKVLHKDGDISQVAAEAADNSDKTMGLKGSKVASRAIKLAANVGLKFLSGATQALQETEGQYGATIRKPTMRNALLNGTAEAALEESNQIASEYKNSAPVIEVKAGTEFFLFFADNGG